MKRVREGAPWRQNP